MKSYKEHLLSSKSFGENISKTFQKPVYKTSAIFPVIESDALHTKILFMGYWLVKRNISQLGFLISLRSEDGKLILRKNSSIDSAKAFEVSIKDLINELDYNIESFIGSIELEIFSTVDLVFPYPAVVIDYYNKMGAGLVHTTGRIYNDIEDLQANESIKVDEAGFDILPSKEYEPFFAFVNGHINSKNTDITIELIKESGEIFSKDINLGEVSPLQTVFFKLKNFLDVDAFLQGEIGTAKIKHNLTGFFPRFIAGNFSRVDNAVSITHTYYDNSENKNSSDYFENENPKILLDSSIFVPLFLEDNWYTQVKLYPIYTPSNHSINLKFFDEKGNLHGEIEDYLRIKEGQSSYFTIDFNKCMEEANLDKSKIKGVQLYKVWQDKTKIPTRLKYGLNIGKRGMKHDLPTNICFNSNISNIKTLDKKQAFKWMPIVNQHQSLIIIQNSSFCKDYSQKANIIVSFYHIFSDRTLVREFVIPANGQTRILPDDEIKDFLNDNSGWITVNSDNPFVTGWYFEFNESGIMGGDHSF